MANYTNPKLRESIKDRIMASDKGGKPGQWSARKAQLVALEYKKAGGSYTGGKTKKQKSLSKWTGERALVKQNQVNRARKDPKLPVKDTYQKPQ
jgi:hypothetical protein